MLKNLYAILPQKEKGEVLLIAFMMIIGMFLETLGIGLIVPVISLLIEPNALSDFPTVSILINKFNFMGKENIFLFMLSILLFVYFFKNVYLFLLNYYKANFAYRVNLYISSTIFSLYLKQPYNFFLNKNSSQLIRNINFEVNQTINVLSSFMLLVSEILVTLGLVILIIYMQPLTAGISIIFLIFIGFVIYYSTKNILTEFGRQRVIYDGSRLKHLQQSFDTVKELKIFDKEEYFKNIYKKNNIGSLKILFYQNILKAVPQYMIEFLAVFLVCSILFYLILYQQAGPEDFIPILSLFAAAAFRMMPSANRILTSLQQVRYSMPSVKMINSEILDLTRTAEQQGDTSVYLKFESKIELKNIFYKYSSKTDWILRNVNLEIPVGSFTGIIGTTGSGKSTLVDIITGLIKPNDGSVLIDDLDLNGNIKNWQSKIGYVSQSINLIDDSLKSNIAFGVKNDEIDINSLENAIKMAGLKNFVNNLPKGIESNIGQRGIKISGGERQRIAIARSLYTNPALIIFDEATSSLDAQTEKSIIKSIEELKGKITVIMIAHRLSTLDNCDKIYKVEDGQIIEDER